MNKVFTKHLVIPGNLKIKANFKWFIVSLLLVSLLCSCNKNGNNVSDDIVIDTVSQSDKLDENVGSNTKNLDNAVQSNVDADEALIKVQEEVETLTGLDNVDVSNLFNIENIYYIKVKLTNLMLGTEYVYADDDNYIETLEYTDTDENGIEKCIGDFYEVWRYEKDTPRRVLYNMTDVVYSQDKDMITIDGKYNNYLIKLCSDDKGKQGVLYECYYTDILNSDNGDFTCYINDFFSVCVINNKNNEVVLNKCTDVDSEFSQKDFVLDNNIAFFPKRRSITEKGWIKNSNIAYFLCYDSVNTYINIDIDKKIIFNPCSSSGASYEGYIDKDNGYVISATTNCGVRIAVDSYMKEEMKKQNNYLYLTNLFTLEKFQIAKSMKSSIDPKKEDDSSISYITSSGERATLDISDMIGKNHVNIRDGFKDMINSKLNLSGNDLDEIGLKQLIISNDKYYQTIKKTINNSNYKYQLINFYNNNYTVLIDEADNIQLNKFNDDVYAYVEDGENTRLIQYTGNNKESVIFGKFDDINFSELNKYISMYNNNGDIIVLDSAGNKYFDGNVFNDALNNINSNDNNNNIELGVTAWDKNNDKLYILTKKDDRLSNIFEVNLINKSIKDLAYNIDCRYENMYIDITKGFAIYNTFPGSPFYTYDEEFNDEVYLYIKYFSTDETVEVAHTKGKSIDYIMTNNELEYYYLKDSKYNSGTYIIEE